MAYQASSSFLVFLKTYDATAVSAYDSLYVCSALNIFVKNCIKHNNKEDIIIK